MAHGESLRKIAGVKTDWIANLAQDSRSAPGLNDQEKAMLEFGEKVTLNSWMCAKEDLDALRGAGFGDEEILEMTLIICHYAFMTRLTDALGAELGPEQESSDLLHQLSSRGVVP